MNKLLLPLMISAAVGMLAACDVDEEQTAQYQAPDVQADTVHVVFSDLDTNRDMRVTRMEAERMPELVAVFDDIDSDDDNRLSSEELVVITDWDEDLAQDEYALLTAVDSHTHVIYDSSTAMNEPAGGELGSRDYDSRWPADDQQTDARLETDQDMAATSDLDANRMDSDLQPPAEDEFDTLDPTGEDAVASSEYPPQPTDEFSTLDPEEDVELDEENMAATETETESGAESEADQPDDGEINLAEVRLSESNGLEVADGDSYVKVDPGQVQVIFDSADADGDDSLNREEAVEIEGLATVFTDLDSDGNGLLIYSEFEELGSTA